MNETTERGEYKITQVLVATGESTQVFASMEKVPAPMRRRMRKAFESNESATMLIATREAKPFLPPSTQTLLLDTAKPTPALDRRFWIEIISCAIAGLIFLIFAIVR
jgi:glycine/D-amino acid oxidase-like deaminating enzyme